MCHKFIKHPFSCISLPQKCCPYQSPTLTSYNLRRLGATSGILSSSNTWASQVWIVPLKSHPSCRGTKSSFQLQRYWEPNRYLRSSGHPPTPQRHSLPTPHRWPIGNPTITTLGQGLLELHQQWKQKCVAGKQGRDEPWAESCREDGSWPKILMGALPVPFCSPMPGQHLPGTNHSPFKTPEHSYDN